MMRDKGGCCGVTKVVLHIGACDSVADVAVNGVWFPQHLRG